MKSHWQILVVDDEEIMCESLAAWLREDGYGVDTASSGREALEKSRLKDFAIYFVDLKMPGGMDGIETMMQIRRLRPEASIIIITAYATVDTAITAMKEGAQEYIVKPCNPEEISLLVNRIIKVKNLQRENTILRKKLTRQYSVHDVISKNPRMREIMNLATDVASLRSTVLIQGESGTGKELVARALHNSGDRADKPFVAVSCAALAETLLESELFGHEKGAFTGAVAQRIGRFEEANQGTIFLDEIADMSSHLQAKLLRVTQDGRFTRVGSNKELQTNARILAATNRILEDQVKAGHFREDLFYRLNVFELNIPPLRERPEDILPLANAFIVEFSQGRARFSPSVAAGLERYSWPGNVRELRNAMERAALLGRGELILPEHLPARVRAAAESAPAREPGEAERLGEIERQAIIQALRKHDFNRTETAKALGISRRALLYKLQRFRELGYPVDPV
jgi:DNA-binding NtrC family response regulator